MILIRQMKLEEVSKLEEIDRSEYIDKIYRTQHGELEEIQTGHECPNWDRDQLTQLQMRYALELNNGGCAYGAFDGEQLAGFGVLAHRYRGKDKDRMQVDLMYVSRSYRRQGIASRIMVELKREAIKKGAKYLYVSSTETASAVGFYTQSGGFMTQDTDDELLALEPDDIHMLIKLDGPESTDH